jgi:hypothetical protein
MNTRRQFIAALAALLIGAGPACRALAQAPGAPAPLDLGSRRELFVDDYLLASMEGAALKVQQPQPQEVVFTADAPWEGNTSAYYTLFQDGDLYRMYYRGSAHAPNSKEELRPQVTCYAESRDGITWRKPELGIYEFEGSKANNIVWTTKGAHNFTVFKDTNPACPPAARYKAVGGKLVLHQSADGIHWEVAAKKSFTSQGTFDSQNLVFYDAQRGEYRTYWRISNTPVRAIGTSTSKDLTTWAPPQFLQYPEGTPQEHLYTNAIQPYFRAPHLFIGFPTRFLPKGSRVEPLFMSSRDGLNFRRFNDAIIPETVPQDRSGNRSNYMTWGLLALPGKPDELSCYATEAYYGPVPGRVRRFTYRLDGFVAVHAAEAATVVTKPLTFAGSKLSLNLVSKGETRVELQDGAGEPLPGFSLADCTPITGDFTNHVVTWKSGADLSQQAGHPVRLRLVMQSADLYSLQFAP